MKRITILLFSALVSLNGLFAEVFENLYVVGNGTTIGWSPENAFEMTKLSDGVFSWEGELTNDSDQRFKFLTSRDWHPSVTCDFNGAGHHTVTSGEEAALFVRPDGDTGGDYAFRVDVAGTYRIDIDLNTMKMTCTKTGDQPNPEPDPEELFIVGSATEAAWNSDNAIELIKNSSGVFTWTGNLKADEGENEFKFLNKRGTFSKTFNPKDGNIEFELGTSYELKFRPFESSPEDTKFKVTETGLYTIDVDLNTMTIVISDGVEPVPDLTQLYLLGNATTAGWERENPIQLTKLSDGVFTWTGPLTTEGGNEFKFINQVGTWYKTFNPKDGDTEFVVSTEYDLSFRPYESSPDDFKFKVTTAGEYTINVNLNTMKITFENAGSVGVADVEANKAKVTVQTKTVTVWAGNTVVTAGIYDLTGKCLNVVTDVTGSMILAENLTAGVYIVKLTVDGKESVQKVIVNN